MSTLIKTVDLWKTEAKTTENVTSLQSKLEGNAELKQMLLSETPWLMDATREAEQKQMLANYFDESQTAYRLADNFSRLSRLQNADGSFSWWKGMAGSPSMTMSVLTTFARLDKMVGVQPEARSMMDAAFLFMDKYIAQEVKAMKASKDAKNLRPSELAVDYLYAVTLQKAAEERIHRIHGVDRRVPSLRTLRLQPMAVLKLNGQTLDMPKATAGMGYVKTAKTGEKMKTLSIEKQTENSSS